MAIPITKRSGLTNADKSVDIEALKSHAASTKAYVVFCLSFPSTQTFLQSKEQLWYGTVSVGTPAKDFTVSFDTGSRAEVRFKLCWPYHLRPQQFFNFSGLGSLSIADGATVSGELYSDTVSVSGLTAVNKTLGVATAYYSNLAVDGFPADGLMGMAFQSISAYNATPVFQSMVSQGQADAPVFSFKLAASGSELYLGGANSALYTGDFAYTPRRGNEQSILSNIDSIIDTGSTLIVGNPSEVKTFYDALGGTDASSTAGPGHYSFPCPSEMSASPSAAHRSPSLKTLNIGPVSAGSSDCVSGIIGQDTGFSFWIIGDVFLRNVYTKFDMSQSPRVGFAKLA
ncbi:acid protease [Imleria badia]|nr:acid protease [Imleria badia]